MKKVPKQIILLSVFLVSKLCAYAQLKGDYEKEIEEWRFKRIENLKSENGWLNLVGLYWLDEGMNSFGSNKENKIVFPEGAISSTAGYFERRGTTVKLVASSNIEIRADGNLFKEGIVFHSDSANTPLLSHGSLRWTLIKRENKIGIRLWNIKSQAIEKFNGIENFAIDSSWRITATLLRDSFLKNISITNILGQTTDQKCAGKLFFTVNNIECTLDVLEEGSELFIIFADATSGMSTYPSGRFLYAKKSGADNKIIIDFNKAINPPCAFTDYATCPLPPKQNFLPIAITAGEKTYGHE